ncbi:RhoGAP-domain-containing protein [Meira miltonrushii]|uniref:RhoGAP-domain-containing protein n=1 Tax=Meira miltonrushii TaxID=1280837 RepID=A0A316VN83_9BASI|nr:RhoGAP-domain-containing protein [Meira miltonrushii]PWN37561.1 RhoGAP-domain-containing protein [Meira miltonrushii]
MDIVNSIGGSLVGHRQNSAAASTSLFQDSNTTSQSDSGPSRMTSYYVKTAGDVSSNVLEIFKSTLFEAESYLAMYEHRVKLEEEYIRGLKNMTEKSKDSIVKLDARIASCLSLDPGGADMPKARLAWKEIRENQLREIDARSHYVETIKQGVIAPLSVYSYAQERIRKRVKDDLKISMSAYDEMRQTTLPRAKKTYDKRCEEVEQIRLQQEAVEDQRLLLSQAAMQREGSQTSHAETSERTLSPAMSSGPSDPDEELSRIDLDQGSTHRRSSSLKGFVGRSKNSQKLSSEGDDPQNSQSSASAGVSPRMGGEANLSTSPMASEKKGHFFEALRSRETWDTARKEGPKKLNALLNRMREGASGNDKSEGGSMAFSPESNTGGLPSLGVSLGNGPGSIKSSQHLALKHVKAKREADEADKAYRKAVFDLETLRMRRQKTFMAAKSSVIEARQELYLTCQAVWMQAEKSIQSLANNQLSFSMHAENLLQGSLDRLGDELGKLEERIVLPEGEKVPYIHYQYGECRDLLFGVSLTDYAFNRAQQAPPHLGPPKAEAPLIVQKCIEYIEEKALDQPGIYRTSAKHSAIQNLAHALERDESRFAFDAAHEEATVVAGVLKQYLRQLPEPVLPMPWEDRVKYTHERQEQIQTGFASLKGRIRRLPPINQATLRAIIEHLAKVASHSDQNKMNASNLSIIFGPLLLSQAEHDATSIAAAMEEDRVTEDLILYADTIFDLSHAGAPIMPTLPPQTGGKVFDFDPVADQESFITSHSRSVSMLTSKDSDFNPLDKAEETAPEHVSIITTTEQSTDTVVPKLDVASPPDPVSPIQQGSLVNDQISFPTQVPRTAAGAYLPPQEPHLSASTSGNDWNDTKAPQESNEGNKKTMSQLINETYKFKPVIKTQPHSRENSAGNPNLLSTPIDNALSTPMTAVSSANASLEHDREHNENLN